MPAPLTHRQGEYLAFIHAYTHLLGQPPAETDIARYFQLSPPAVHRMLKALVEEGHLAREAGKARSWRVLVPPQQLPLLPGIAPIPAQTAGQPSRILAQIQPEEALSLLRRLLEGHPYLIDEAEEMLRGNLESVDREAIAEDIGSAIQALGLDDLNRRAGPRGDYIDPTEAAWAMLQEAIEPHQEEMERLHSVDLSEASRATCEGILMGLYRLRERSDHAILSWAPDFLTEAASETLAQWRSGVKPAPRLTEGFLAEHLPRWADFLARLQR